MGKASSSFAMEFAPLESLQRAKPSPWQMYERIRELNNSGHHREALAEIARTRAETAEIWSFVAQVEASCHLRAGEPDIALHILRNAVARTTDNFWVYYQLAKVEKELGLFENAAETIRVSHALQGWPESQRNRYVFTDDYFSPNIPTWQTWFAEHIRAAPLDCIEIGSWQGASATWLLDKVLGPRGGSLTCLDTFQGSSEHASWLGELSETIEQMFDRNVAASGHADRVIKMVGPSNALLPALLPASYDFVYVDGAHESKFVIQDAVFSWRLLRAGGFMVFDDLDFNFPLRPEQDTRRAVEAFCSWFADELQVVDDGRQRLIRKS